MRRAALLGVCVFALGACRKPGPATVAAPAPAPVAVAPEKPAESAEPEAPPVVREMEVDAKKLEPETRRVALLAAKDGRRVFLYFGATWCGPCRLLKTAFERGNNRKTFEKWVLVRVNADDVPAGPILGLEMDRIPFFIKLDAKGKVAGTLAGSKLPEPGHPDAVDASLARFLRS